MTLADLILAGGVVHLGILVASALVPVRLNWQRDLLTLTRLHRQLFWVYGGYVVLSIVALGVISLANSEELAAGGRLARCFCGYVAVFWGVRLLLQLVLDAGEHLSAWWLRAGYHLLSILFLFLTAVFGYAAVRPGG